MTSSKIALAILALGFSFGPALAESGETNARLAISSNADVMSGPTRNAGPTEMMHAAFITPAQQAVIDHNEIGRGVR